MKKTAHELYHSFDKQCRIAEAEAADAEDLQEIEQLEESLKQKDKRT